MRYLFLLFALLYLPAHACFAQATVVDDSATENVHATPQILFKQFAEKYNAGDWLGHSPLLSRKTKGVLLFSTVFGLGMASEEQKAPFADWNRKWSPSITELFKEADLEDQSDYSPVVLRFSKWNKLDECLKELNEIKSKSETSQLRGTPQYSAELQDLQMEDSRAKGTIKLLVNGGIVSGLDGNPLKWLKVKPIPIYFIKIDNKWFVCNEVEYQGKF